MTLGWKIPRRDVAPESPALDSPELGLDEVWAALDQVIDPELGVPITDLGLIYGVHEEGDRLRVVMTTTTPICPLGSYLQQEIERRLVGREVVVDLVHEPLWAPEMMNDRARRQLGWAI